MADYLGMGEETGFPQQRLNQQQQLAQIAGTQATTQHTLASSNYLANLSRSEGVRADQAQLEYDTDKKIADLHQLNSERGGDQDPMSMLTRDAGIYIKAGLIKKGADLLKAAGEVTSKEMTAGARAMDAQTRAAKQKLESLGKIENALANATDEQSWEAGKQAILAADPSSKDLVAKMGNYSPEKAAYYQNAVTSYKDKMKVQNDTRRNDLYEKLVESEKSRREALTNVDKQKLDLARQREQRLAKAAGKSGQKPAGMPGKAELAEATSQLQSYGLDATDSDAQDIAQEARQLWKNNPGLTPAAATAQVIQGKIKSGDIKPGKSEPGMFFGQNKVPGRIFSVTHPIELPKDLSSVEQGQYYQTKKGVAKYLGNGKFSIVESGGGGSRTPEPPEEGEEE